jgi:hypothetical protein
MNKSRLGGNSVRNGFRQSLGTGLLGDIMRLDVGPLTAIPFVGN